MNDFSNKEVTHFAHVFVTSETLPKTNLSFHVRNKKHLSIWFLTRFAVILSL